MSAREAWQAGELEDALALQEEAVEAQPQDSSARLFLFELLTLAGLLNRAREELLKIESDSPDWPQSRSQFHNILRAQSRRRKGRLSWSGHPPHHARWRRKLWHKYRHEQWNHLHDYVDRADRLSPMIVGHVDGREFEGLRDVDDRFGSVLEIFTGPNYSWIPFEHLRKIVLAPAVGVLDVAFRPGRITVGTDEYPVILPLIYPETHYADEVFSLGLDTDFIAETDQVMHGIGARIWMLGDEEVLLGECRQIDLRPG